MSGPRALTDYDTSPKAPRSSSKTRIVCDSDHECASRTPLRASLDRAAPIGGVDEHRRRERSEHVWRRCEERRRRRLRSVIARAGKYCAEGGTRTLTPEGTGT